MNAAPSLDASQLALLATLTRAWREVREEFHTMAGDNEVRVYHDGLDAIGENGLVVNTFDLEALHEANAIRISVHRRYGDYTFTVTPHGADLADRDAG